MSERWIEEIQKQAAENAIELDMDGADYVLWNETPFPLGNTEEILNAVTLWAQNYERFQERLI